MSTSIEALPSPETVSQVQVLATHILLCYHFHTWTKMEQSLVLH